MSIDTIQSSLRVMAVASILVGAVMISNALIAQLGVQQAMARMPEEMRFQLTSTVASAGFWGFVSAGMPALWGAVLYALSSRLAELIRKQ